MHSFLISHMDSQIKLCLQISKVIWLNSCNDYEEAPVNQLIRMCHWIPLPVLCPDVLQYPPSKHTLLSGILAKNTCQGHASQSLYKNGCCISIPALLWFQSSFYYFSSCSHKTYNHCSSILTERILMVSKTWISITHCFFSLNNNLLNTFFIISGKNSVDLHFIYMECELQGSLHNLQNVHMNLTSLGHKPRDKTFAEAKSELCRWHPKQLLPP